MRTVVALAVAPNAAGEGVPLVKVRTPMCLSYHPKAPLSPEEVISRAVRH